MMEFTLNENLNENQLWAVEWNDGPLLVLAGPGSGKTYVLTLRAARLLKENPDKSVLALTFGNKAADEMRDRLNILIGGKTERANLCTFHSFAADLLRQHGSHIGLRPDFSLLTLDEDRIAFLEMLLDNSGRKRPEYKNYSKKLIELSEKLNEFNSLIPKDYRNLLNLIERLFADSYDGEGTITSLGKIPEWTPTLFEAYCLILLENNRLDYGSLLHFSKKLLVENPAVIRLTRLSWDYICVDEFQDTNRAQYELLKLIIAEKSPDLFVVADDDQIIYQWNGASPKRLKTLCNDYDMEIIQLPENYRCPPGIIDTANRLISCNKHRARQKSPLTAHKKEDSEITVRSYRTESEETNAVSEMIIQRGYNPDDCAVIARNSKLLEIAAESLQKREIPYYLPKKKSDFESPSVRFMLAILRLANARHDREYLRRLCIAWEAFTGEIIETENIIAASALKGGDFLRTWIKKVSEDNRNDNISELLEKLNSELLERLKFKEILEWFWKREWCPDAPEKEENEIWQDMHYSLMNESYGDNISLNQYLQGIDLKSKISPKRPGSVSCLTVHSSKGLEFKNVFLIGMAEDIFPSYYAIKRGSDSKEMEEERRNCFVAITRVKENLHISWSDSYYGFKKNPSGFLSEMGVIKKEYKPPGEMRCLKSGTNKQINDCFV